MSIDEENYPVATIAVDRTNNDNSHNLVMMGQWEIGGRFLQDENGTDVSFDTNTTSANETTPSENPGTDDFPAESPTAFGGNETTATTTTTPAPSSNGEFPPTDSEESAPTDAFEPATAPTISDAFQPSAPSSFPPPYPSKYTPAPSYSTSGGSAPYKSDSMIGLLFVIVVALVGVFLAWRFWKVCQARRERHMLRVQSTRVDAALGDLQVRFIRSFFYASKFVTSGKTFDFMIIILLMAFIFVVFCILVKKMVTPGGDEYDDDPELL
jgi:hypothetical protein